MISSGCRQARPSFSRRLLVGSFSATIVLTMALFVVAPTTESFATTLHSEGVVRGRNIVVYGQVEKENGSGLRGASVCAESIIQRRPQGIKVCTTTGAGGVYRIQFLGGTGRYVVTFSSRGISARVRTTIHNGERLRIDARRVFHNRFLAFPVSSY